MLETVTQILTEECPFRWQVISNKPGLIEFRAKELSSPHGLSLQVQYGAHVSTCTIYFDAFAGNVAQAVRESFQTFTNEGLSRSSTSAWEHRVSVDPRDTSDSVGTLISTNEEGTTIGNAPINVLDVLSAAGWIVGCALFEKSVKNFPEPDDTLEVGFPEGDRASVQVNKYERDSRNRARAIQIHGRDCMVCGMNFGKEYGPAADGYIHIHHTVPVSQLGPNYSIDPAKELVPLCANCHAAAHRRNPPFTIEELRSLRDR